MTLQQHFANSRRATIVAINLKRRMRTEQVGESAATMTSRRSIDSRMQQTLEEFPSTVSVTQTSPEVYLPSTAPTSTLISTTVQGHPAGFGKLGGGLRRNQVSRMQAVEMGNVAVVHIHFLIIFQPFLQVSFLTDLHGWESLQVHLKLRHIIRITIQQASGGDDISIKLSEQLHIHSGTHTNADGSHAVTRHIETVFRRRSGGSYQPAMRRLLHRSGTKEPGGTFQDGIDTTQIILVLRIQIVFPQMGTQPSATGIGSSPGGVFAGSGIIPYVGHHVEHPAICLIAIEGTRTCLSRRDKALHQRRQRLIEFGEAGLFQRPVVHLDIDVRMIVPVPGSRYSICPESLQIGRQAAGAGTADEQIASVVIVQSSQCRRLLLCEAEDALVRRERIIRRGRKRQGNTVVEETVGSDMAGE